MLSKVLSCVPENTLSFTPLTSSCQLQRFTALAAVSVGTTRPLLGAAIHLRGNDRVVRELRCSFPQHRRVVDRIRRLSQDLNRRLLRKPLQERGRVNQSDTVTPPKRASSLTLKAARQAIFELGPDADRSALLATVDAIWTR